MTVSLDMEEGLEGMRGQDMRDMTVGRKSLDMIGMVERDGKKGQDMKGMVGGRKDLRNMVGEEKYQGLEGMRKDISGRVVEKGVTLENTVAVVPALEKGGHLLQIDTRPETTLKNTVPERTDMPKNIVRKYTPRTIESTDTPGMIVRNVL